MVAAIDSTLPQFTADVLLVILIIANAVLGWRTGTLRRVFSFGGLFAAAFAAYYMGNGVAGAFRKGDVLANAWGFLAVLVVVVILFEVLGRVFAERLDHLATMTFDRVGGMILGATLGFFQATVLFMVALGVGTAAPAAGIVPSHGAATNAVRTATLAGQAVRVEPGIRTIFSPVMPADLRTHFQDGTPQTTSS
jgi:hypothetical protein